MKIYIQDRIWRGYNVVIAKSLNEVRHLMNICSIRYSPNEEKEIEFGLVVDNVGDL